MGALSLKSTNSNVFSEFMRFYPRFTFSGESVWLASNIVLIPLSKCFNLVKTNFGALKMERKESSFSSNHVGIYIENTANQI